MIAFFVENVYIYIEKGIVEILPSRFSSPTEFIHKSCPAATAFNIDTHVRLVIMRSIIILKIIKILVIHKL